MGAKLWNLDFKPTSIVTSIWHKKRKPKTQIENISASHALLFNLANTTLTTLQKKMFK